MEIRVIEAITIDIPSKRVVAKYLRICHSVWTKNLSLGVVVCVWLRAVAEGEDKNHDTIKRKYKKKPFSFAHSN